MPPRRNRLFLLLDRHDHLDQPSPPMSIHSSLMGKGIKTSDMVLTSTEIERDDVGLSAEAAERQLSATYILSDIFQRSQTVTEEIPSTFSLICAALQKICESPSWHMKTRNPIRLRSLSGPSRNSPKLPCKRDWSGLHLTERSRAAHFGAVFFRTDEQSGKDILLMSNKWNAGAREDQGFSARSLNEPHISDCGMCGDFAAVKLTSRLAIVAKATASRPGN